MINIAQQLIEGSGFLPHGQSFMWRPGILGTQVTGDVLIALSYFIIAPALFYLTLKRKDLSYKIVFVLFAIFMFTQGLTSVLNIITIWKPLYQFQGILKVITGLFSLATAVFLLRLVPRILQVPSHARLEVANARLLAEISERERAQVALRQANEALETRVQQRTAQLIKINRELEREIEVRRKAETNLMTKNVELVRINTDLDNFVYCASHDLKAPIVNIEGLVSALKEEIPQPTENVNAILERLDGTLLKIDRTILDLTEVSRIQQNPIHEETNVLRFADVLGSVEKSIQDLIRDNNAEITSDFSEAETVCFSRQNLKSILYNLLTNSIKYRSPNRTPKIHLQTEIDGDCVLLQVTDNGVGINLPKYEQKIFSLFRRLNDNVEGSGIGLYIVKRILDNNQGRIQVKSTPGEGSTFKVFLPIHKEV